jgi:hypothetical protein
VSNYGADRLYQLLPSVYRLRDADQGYPLRDLVEILAGQATLLERDIFQLYENWFVETCEPWAVPYIGDLIGVRGTNGSVSRRAEVADTLDYRRAKGTADVLARLARDVTGWPARVVEYFELLETTQNVNHVRPANLRTPDLRRTSALELLGGPFEVEWQADGVVRRRVTAAHTAEVRRIAVGRGRYNIPSVGLFLWRLQAYPLEHAMPHAADGTRRNFTFDVLGLDQPLFHSPAAATGAAFVADELNVPAPIRRRAFNEALASYYGVSVEIWDDWHTGTPVPAPLPAAQIAACDLTDWNRPRPDGKVAVDPVLGRLSFPAAQDPAKVRVSFHYGFSDDLGGGPYQREASFTNVAGEATLQVGEAAGPGGFPTLAAALAHWNGAGSAVIEILDSRTYAETLTLPAIQPQHRLEIRAANEERPALLLPGELQVTGGAQSGFELNGLLVAGGPLRITGPLDRVRLQHTTLVPGRSVPALIVEPGSAKVSIERSILGAVQTDPETQVELADSIVDAVDGAGTVHAAYESTTAAGAVPVPGAPGGPLTVSRCTVIGEVHTTELALAENSLFLDPVTAARRQQGCVRFCLVPPGSRTPRRYRCQPELPDGASPEEQLDLAARVRPRFTSLRYGAPGYCQLTVDTSPAIRSGAEDESEMGVFSSLRQPQREGGLRIRLDEYLRVGLEAGIRFVT